MVSCYSPDIPNCNLSWGFIRSFSVYVGTFVGTFSHRRKAKFDSAVRFKPLRREKPGPARGAIVAVSMRMKPVFGHWTVLVPKQPCLRA